ncbi:hypothetical protein M5Y66_09925 [Enterobacter vonholyi]|uniref:hypothetical protein n=1 Tax=Enterobacter vonholyi TaxID=2797505 RepID=UPI0020BDF6D6|nr:hypothetical protein [Enterobacter vonholyi]MCL5634819.1 hypothetical protein [Enterobacter vonholyi]
MFELYAVKYAKTKGVLVDVVFWLIFLALVYISVTLTKVANTLARIKNSNEIAIKCLDAHEVLIKKSNEEIEQQGVSIEQIRDLMIERR